METFIDVFECEGGRSCDVGLRCANPTYTDCDNMKRMPRKPSPKPYGPEEARAEHRACVDYHTALVNSRFTIAGLYVAAMGFIAGAVFKGEITWDFRAAVSLLACWLTVCLWILELRSRALFTNVAQRGIEIERRYWKLDGENIMAGFFSRQHKLPADTVAVESSTAPRRARPDRPVLGWRPNEALSERWARLVSHSMGLDLLFLGGLIFWACSTAISTIYWLRLLAK